MTEHAPAPPTPADTRELNGQLIGDRLCIRCGFNLHGQDIFREKTYGMLAVRCPECATLASMQEYPLASRWAGRLGALMLAIWVLTLIGGIAATMFVHGGFIERIIDGASYPYASIIANEHAGWFQSLTDLERQQLQIRNANPWPHAQLDPSWLAGFDHDRFLREHAGSRGIVDGGVFVMILFAALVLAPVGITWSVVLSHIRRRWLALLALGPALFACALHVLFSFDVGGWTSARELARHELMPILLPICTGVCMLIFVTAVILGRSIARLLVRLLLPPHLRGLTAFLWRADGLEPPRLTPRGP